MNAQQLDLRPTTAAADLLPLVEEIRMIASTALDQERRPERGQFLTPISVARLMASMFSAPRAEVRLLDAGAGAGSLTAATVAAVLARDELPTSIEVVAYEVEQALEPYLQQTLDACGAASGAAGVSFSARIEPTDFLEATARCVASRVPAEFNTAILNPPYRKIRAASEERARCRAMGLEVSNLYAAFVGATLHHLQPGAELVAITPRSFANGPYFRAFRDFLLGRVALRRLHVFDSRNRAFSDDAVLQENVILHAERSATPPAEVEITASAAPDEPIRSRRVPFGRVVSEHDPERFIHLIVDPEGDAVAQRMAELDHYLRDLGVTVSTGPVVDFRATDQLRHLPEDGTVPLFYPMHMRAGAICWPRPERAKWNALALDESSYSLTVPRGDYVLVKRFTAKEERRRVVAAVLEAKSCATERVGFENHLNYFHEGGESLPLDLARGLALYLNSSLVDSYFRQFSGHTQVNAADLRNMPYPARDRLEAAGREVGGTLPEQAELDRLAQRLLFSSRL
jgi:adenine-specific DNA-methyltransferase